jgi:hypothetical protein
MARNGRVIVGCTNRDENPDRVVVAYLTAGAALDQGEEVVMWLTSEGARLVLRGYADRIRAGKEPPVEGVHAQFIEGRTLLHLPDLLQRARPRQEPAGRGRPAAGRHPADAIRRRRRHDLHLLTLLRPAPPALTAPDADGAGDCF